MEVFSWYFITVFLYFYHLYFVALYFSAIHATPVRVFQCRCGLHILPTLVRPICLGIGVGRLRILGGPRFRILGGPNSQQAHDVVLTSMRRNDVASTSFRRHVPTRFLINQCQIITFFILKSDGKFKRIESNSFASTFKSN